MTTIGEALGREWAATPLYARLTAETHRYHDPNETPEAPVSLIDVIRSEISTAVTWGEDELRQRLPTVVKLADDAEHAAQSPLVQAALAAVLPASVEQSLASMIANVDGELRAAEARVQAAMPQPDPAADVEPAPA